MSGMTTRGFPSADVAAMVKARREELSALLAEERILSYSLNSAGEMAVTSCDGVTVVASVFASVFGLFDTSPPLPLVIIEGTGTSADGQWLMVGEPLVTESGLTLNVRRPT